MASRILNSQIVASIKRAGVRYQSTAIDGGFTAERDAVKHHAAGNLFELEKRYKQYKILNNLVCI
jgi:hypothetical protein